ncbi:MAG: tRNA (N(6)-L-threonylcarbamoyladenosine(37)-C(2))-methylthiotransferase MtaB [Lachnospiraceae bacterium]|nr:tRNA (N(6)-L-threonylcarbamoyladenosine(37)-C(2))-methylthiotransferase MtaB [Lachnospiraceae bacterium]
MAGKAALHNLGCKVNAYETEMMRGLLEEAGYEIVPFAPGADVYVINTCTVTNIADRKSRQMLHKARKMNPDAIVVAVGCYVETAVTPVEEDGTVDLVLGNRQKQDIVEVLRQFEAARMGIDSSAGINTSGENENAAFGQTAANQQPNEQSGKVTNCYPLEEQSGQAMVSCSPNEQSKPAPGSNLLVKRVQQAAINNQTDVWENQIDTKSEITHTADQVCGRGNLYDREHTRACIKVQDGCNQFCTYCIIPYARGRIQSRPIEDVLREIRVLSNGGCREVVLTGIHLSSYGKDTGTTLLSLIQAVHEIPGIGRIRLGSLEPGIITEEFARALRRLPKVCPHFHLSLQSGCDTVLKRMNRHYTAEEYARKCAILREVFDRPALTTDVIVGFPQETLEEFGETVSFLRQIRLYETHIFKYSARHGTRAAAMSGQIPESDKSIRSNVLIELGEQNRTLYEQECQGMVCEALFEEKMAINGTDYFVGYTKEYVRVAVPAKAAAQNQILGGTLGKPLVPHVIALNM